MRNKRAYVLYVVACVALITCVVAFSSDTPYSDLNAYESLIRTAYKQAVAGDCEASKATLKTGVEYAERRRKR